MPSQVPMIQQKLSFAVATPVYLTASSNVIVPSLTCCKTLFNVVSSKLPDGTFFISTQDDRYLDTVFIDLKGPGSFFSIQLVPYQGVRRGWAMENSSTHVRFSQQLDSGKVYLGLALDQKTVQGFDLAQGIYASVDLQLEKST